MSTKMHSASMVSGQSSSISGAATLTSAFQFPRFLGERKEEEKEFILEAFLEEFRMREFLAMDMEQRKYHLTFFDAMDLYTAFEDIRKETSVVKLENHILQDFLTKNDPKLLAGLQQLHQTPIAKRFGSVMPPPRATISSPTNSRSEKSSIMTGSMSRRSLGASSGYTAVSTKRFGGFDYRLNYRARIDMAEKTSTDVEKRIIDIEKKGMKDIKMLNARIEELKALTNETKETTKNFQLHFLADQRDMRFLETATEKQLERKFRKFINNWFKCARALLGTMRLRITAIQENCQQLRNDLITKSDLSGILTAVDFQKLQIVRDELQTSLDEKNNHMAGLKSITGKATLRMTEEKHIMMQAEAESKRIANKTAEIIKHIGKLEKESRYVDEHNRRDLKTLEELKEQCERFTAPSVNEYIEIKDELHLYEKEEKMLQRKTYIMHMKLSNMIKKFKKKMADLNS